MRVTRLIRSCSARLVAGVSAAVALADRTGRIRMDDAAKALWRREYSRLSAAHPGMFGAATGRAEMHVVRLSVAIALLCGSQTIGVDHLRAALEFWRYAADSARHIWGDKLGDAVADTIITELRRAGDAGTTRTALHHLLGPKRQRVQDRRSAGCAGASRHGAGGASLDPAGPSSVSRTCGSR